MNYPQLPKTSKPPVHDYLETAEEANPKPTARGKLPAPVPDDREIETSPVAKEIKIDEALSQANGLKRFKELDRLIITGLTQSLIVSKALREMEHGQFYDFGGFKTIAEYGLKTMKLAQSTVHQYVNAGRVANLIEDSTDCRVKPINEAQLRPLLNVEDDRKVIEIWNTATLHGEGGLTEKAVAKAKRMVLKQEFTKPTHVDVEEVAQTIDKAIRRGLEACKTERAKLLDKLLLALKDFYDELDHDERNLRLTAIFTHIEIVEPEPDTPPRRPPPSCERLPELVPETEKAFSPTTRKQKQIKSYAIESTEKD